MWRWSRFWTVSSFCKLRSSRGALGGRPAGALGGVSAFSVAAHQMPVEPREIASIGLDLNTNCLMGVSDRPGVLVAGSYQLENGKRIGGLTSFRDGKVADRVRSIPAVFDLDAFGSGGLAAACGDGVIRTYEVSVDGKISHDASFIIDDEAVLTHVKCFARGFLATSDRGRMYLYGLSENALLGCVKCSEYETWCCCECDGMYLTGSDDGFLCLYNAELELVSRYAHDAGVTHVIKVDLSSDYSNDSAVALCSVIVSASYDGRLRVFKKPDAANPTLENIATFTIDTENGLWRVRPAMFGEDRGVSFVLACTRSGYRVVTLSKDFSTVLSNQVFWGSHDREKILYDVWFDRTEQTIAAASFYDNHVSFSTLVQ